MTKHCSPSATRYFDRPARIAGPRLPEIVGANGAEAAPPRTGTEKFASGYVLASLTVDASGSARDAVIVEAEPPGLLDARLLRTLKATAFRPRMQGRRNGAKRRRAVPPRVPLRERERRRRTPQQGRTHQLSRRRNDEPHEASP